ncbi:MAG: urea transporter [Clostridiales Family XIII bacterium]|jgi:urea transporter|nr:urea transporter [Clostridiales Family XIII bacterium]
MAALATCKFPFVDRWKAAADGNVILGFIDSVLSGYGQIAFNDNPLSGLLFMIGCFVGSVQNGVSSVICALTATATAYLLRVPAASLRPGLYTFNAALAGMGIALFIFPGQAVTGGLVLFSVIGGVLCVFLTAAFSGLLSKWEVPPLALPYSTVLFILVPASLLLPIIEPTTSVVPHLGEMAVAASQDWTFTGFLTAFMNNFSEVLWQSAPLSGAFFLAGVLVASRVDFVMAIVGSALASGFAIALGLPQESNLIGIYGYNAVLLLLVLFGRGYAMSVRNFLFSVALALISVLFTVWLSALFAPLGAPVAAFPYALLSIFALLSRNGLAGLRWINPLKWGVPETIAKELKREDAQKRQV